MSYVWTYIHKMGNTGFASSFSIALKEFANLKKQHDEDRFRKFCFCTWKESDAEGSECGHRHEEMFVEGVAVGYTLSGFLQRVIAYNNIRYKINQQQLPCRQLIVFLYQDCSNEQYDRDNDTHHLFLQVVVLVVMFVFVMMTTVFAMIVLMCHIPICFHFLAAKVGIKLCNLVANTSVALKNSKQGLSARHWTFHH